MFGYTAIAVTECIMKKTTTIEEVKDYIILVGNGAAGFCQHGEVDEDVSLQLLGATYLPLKYRTYTFKDADAKARSIARNGKVAKVLKTTAATVYTPSVDVSISIDIR